jgi:hypothetical protein
MNFRIESQLVSWAVVLVLSRAVAGCDAGVGSSHAMPAELSSNSWRVRSRQAQPPQPNADSFVSVSEPNDGGDRTDGAVCDAIQADGWHCSGIDTTRVCEALRLLAAGGRVWHVHHQFASATFPSLRAAARRAAEKCRSELRLDTRQVLLASVARFRLLVIDSGDVVARSAVPSDRTLTLFDQCVIRELAEIRVVPQLPIRGAWEVTLPPAPLRWWADPLHPVNAGNVW